MRLNEASFGGAAAVEGYGPGFFRAGGAVWQGPILIRPEGVTPWGGLDDTAPLLALAGQVDVLFLGLGSEVAHAPRALREALETAGLGLEPMSSPAAARTYNVLLSEGRALPRRCCPSPTTGA